MAKACVAGDRQLVGAEGAAGAGVAPPRRAQVHPQAARAPHPVGLFHHQVDDPGRTVRRKLRRGIGDHFHALDRICRQRLQRLGRALAAEQGRWLAVHQNGDVGVAAQGDIALHVHLDGGDILQSIADRPGRRGQIVGDAVAAPVDRTSIAVLRNPRHSDFVHRLAGGSFRRGLGGRGFLGGLARRGGWRLGLGRRRRDRLRRGGLRLRLGLGGGRSHGHGQQDAYSVSQDFPRVSRAV